VNDYGLSIYASFRRPARRSVLYRDDRQVRFLYVDLDQEWSRKDCDGTSTGRLFMVARRASDFRGLYRPHMGHPSEEPML
jgi:hypothetical protein